MDLKKIKKGVIWAIVAILVLTVLEFPAPIGFETRPQNNVSMGWLALFFAIVVSEIAAIPLIVKKPALGKKFAITAGVLNIIQIFADQLHLMQPEVAPVGYTLLEIAVGTASVVLIYFASKIKK